jgi:hypothetical protein
MYSKSTINRGDTNVLQVQSTLVSPLLIVDLEYIGISSVNCGLGVHWYLLC